MINFIKSALQSSDPKMRRIIMIIIQLSKCRDTFIYYFGPNELFCVGRIWIYDDNKDRKGSRTHAESASMESIVTNMRKEWGRTVYHVTRTTRMLGCAAVICSSDVSARGRSRQSFMRDIICWWFLLLLRNDLKKCFHSIAS